MIDESQTADLLKYDDIVSVGSELVIDNFIFWVNCLVYFVEDETPYILFCLISTTMSLQVFINKDKCLFDNPENLNWLLCSTILLQDLNLREISVFVIHGLV